MKITHGLVTNKCDSKLTLDTNNLGMLDNVGLLPSDDGFDIRGVILSTGEVDGTGVSVAIVNTLALIEGGITDESLSDI